MLSSKPSIARTIVYISNADSREIFVLGLGAEGGLTLIEKVAVGGTVMPLAVSPDHRFLYASLRSEPFSVASFAIDAGSGRLTPLATAPLADNMAYLSTDRTGRFLLAASYAGSRISVNAIGAGGKVDPAPLQVLSTGKNAHSIVADPTNRFVFVPNLGDDIIQHYRFDAATGRLTPNEPSAVKTRKGAGPRHLVFHPNGRWAFCTNELDGTVSAYRLDASGTLTATDWASVMPDDFKGGPPSTADLHLTPDGKFLYISERTSSTLAAFAVNGESGRLSRIGNYPTESQPRGFAIDPSGKYLLAAGQKSNRVSTYEINSDTGALRKVSQMDLGQNPNWIEMIALP